MKKALSLILVLVMLLGMMPMQVFATEGTQETEAVEVVTEPTEAPEEETTAPAEETEPSDEEEEPEPSDEEEEEEPSDEEEEEEPSEPSESEEESEVIHEHDYEAVVTDPTCTNQGYTTYTCACGDSYESDYVDALGHTYKNGICTGCGEEDTDGLDLNGLNVLCLGDSITAGQGLTTATRWTNVLASKYDWNLTNKSQGGISLSSYYYTANGKSDVSIAKKAEILKTMTTKPDVIIVWGGHNDTSYRYSPLGTGDDETTDSFKGALKYIAELADEYAPDATLFVLTPLWTTEAPSTLKVPENTTDNNWMFVDAIYEGAEAYGWIPVNMDLCGITPFTKSGLLLDNIHPNEAGTEKIVAYLSAELASYSETSKKETIIFNASAVSMKPGESTTLKAVLSPRSGTGTMTFTWSSSDSSVATVDTSGKITAVAPGTAVITATAPNGISADISVSVVCEHTYEPSVTAPTCTEQGYTTYTCECGDSYVADYVDATGHTYKNGICTVCGATQPGPVITQRPESVQQEVGKKFAITVMAEGEGLTYQWYVKDSGAKAFKVSSNKTASYAYTMQTYMHNRQVYCVVTDANGNSVQTETATISRPPQTLKILQQPQDARVNEGEKFSISPKVEGEGLIYQWYVKENGAKAFKVSSVRGSAYALTMQKYMIGRQVYCVITDKHGNSVTTDVATISLPPVELKILEQPSDVYASKGEKFSISPKVQGEGLTYQWYYKEGYMKNFKPSSNKTSAYAYSMQLYMNERSVYCVITDKFGNQVQTEAVTIYLGNLIMK